MPGRLKIDFKKVPNLKNLALTHCDDVDQLSLSNIRSLTNIEYLSVVYHQELQDEKESVARKRLAYLKEFKKYVMSTTHIKRFTFWCSQEFLPIFYEYILLDCIRKNVEIEFLFQGAEDNYFYYSTIFSNHNRQQEICLNILDTE
eukprot:UN27706